MTSVGTPRLKRQVLRDDVAEALLEMVLDEHLQPSATLSIDGLARELGVSPTPVREALAYLEHTGLVARSALKGYRVAPRLSGEQMSSLIEARSVVETAAMAEAMARPDEVLPTLREAHGQHLAEASTMLRAAGDGVPPGHTMRTYFQADWGFHLVIVEATGNDFLRRMLESVGAHLHRMLQSAGRGVMDWNVALSEHGRILSAVEAGDAQAAVTAMRDHLDGVRRRALADLTDAAPADLSI